MTAINVLLMPDEVHVFSDGGHHDGKILRYIAPKAYPLPRYNMVFAWSGESAAAERILNAIDLCNFQSASALLGKISAVVQSVFPIGPYSGIFVAMVVGKPTGVVVDKKLTGEIVVHELEQFSVVRTLGSEIEFNPSNIVGSALRMMEDQKETHGVVAGFVMHHVISHTGIRVATLKKWNDVVAGGFGTTHAAKITEVEVDKITIDKVANNATIGCQISAIANGGSVTVPNEENLPVIFSLYFQMIYTGTGASSFCRSNWKLTRTRGTLNVAGGGAAKQGNVSVTLYMNSSGIDSTSQNNDTYTLTTELTQIDGGNFAMSNGKLRATYIKR